MRKKANGILSKSFNTVIKNTWENPILFSYSHVDAGIIIWINYYLILLCKKHFPIILGYRK